MELPDLRFVESADVYKGDLHAGTLTRLPNGDVEFSYLPDYSGEPVSFSLPLGEKAVRPGELFRHSLPGCYQRVTG